MKVATYDIQLSDTYMIEEFVNSFARYNEHFSPSYPYWSYRAVPMMYLEDEAIETAIRRYFSQNVLFEVYFEELYSVARLMYVLDARKICSAANSFKISLSLLEGLFNESIKKRDFWMQMVALESKINESFTRHGGTGLPFSSANMLNTINDDIQSNNKEKVVASEKLQKEEKSKAEVGCVNKVEEYFKRICEEDELQNLEDKRKKGDDKVAKVVQEVVKVVQEVVKEEEPVVQEGKEEEEPVVPVGKEEEEPVVPVGKEEEEPVVPVGKERREGSARSGEGRGEGSARSGEGRGEGSASR
ncbi:hypothetical protein Fsol_00161 [Candidatus Fokinia solitaria]|uniref:Uncharacterized protein n=1 Tax=Candidatus Fokinia solitaria TaxID=1802984 RepID=A0A2U8BRL2_9RICK|nr:hypothetical protein [Candidatus Fokinia solitaria]AWD32968.1 hypothetical protein Fsol_00161 [Candidatus Fokinia solitaria]